MQPSCCLFLSDQRLLSRRVRVSHSLRPGRPARTHARMISVWNRTRRPTATRPGMSRAASMRRNVRTLRLVRWASPAMSISSLSVGEGTTSPVLPDRVGGKGTMSPAMGHLPGSALLGEPAGNPLAFPKLVLEAEGEVRRGQLAVGDIAPEGPRVETDSLPELFEGDVFPQPFDGGHLGWEAQGGAPVLRSAGRPGRLLNSLPRGRPGPWVPGRGTLALGGVGGGHGPLSFS